MLGLPYAGSGVTASAIGMDKGHMKHAFAAAKLPMVEFVQVHEHDWHNERERILRAVNNALRLPYFVKPANGGSSVGVTKVKNDGDLGAAIEKAFRFDEKALVERGIDAREIEVAVLGNDDPQASVPGEIIAGREFYDYEDKYVDDKTQLVIPADAAEGKDRGVPPPRHRRVQSDRRVRLRARRLFPRARQEPAVRERDQHHPRLHEHLHVSEAVGSDGAEIPAPDRAHHRARHRTLPRARTRGRKATMKWFDEVKRIV